MFLLVSVSFRQFEPTHARQVASPKGDWIDHILDDWFDAANALAKFAIRRDHLHARGLIAARGVGLVVVFDVLQNPVVRRQALSQIDALQQTVAAVLDDFRFRVGSTVQNQNDLFDALDERGVAWR